MYWLQTFTGKKIDLINPTSKMVDIEDIAHSLSMICRFNGHCRDFYSVAEHSVLVESIGTPVLLQFCLDPPTLAHQRLSLLLHDAAEAYIGDITTPLKRGLDSVGCDVGFVVPEGQVSKIEALELRWLLAIGEAFGLGDWLARPPVIVRQADAKMFAIEVPQLFHPVQSSWWENRERPRSGEVSIQCWPPAEARRQFINRFRELYEILQSGPGWTEIEAGRP